VIQGHVVARPMPAEDATEWLSSWQRRRGDRGPASTS
jgi:EAL domain-containing protein (putative c-di-GMP-specific phosphodiesterase class I)